MHECFKLATSQNFNLDFNDVVVYRRRDEIMDKIRHLEDSAFSDSETEDEMDFAESVRRKTGQSALQGQTLEEIFEEEGAFVEEVDFAVSPTQTPIAAKNTQPNQKNTQNKRKNRQKKRGNNENRMDVSATVPLPPYQQGYHYSHSQYQHQYQPQYQHQYQHQHQHQHQQHHYNYNQRAPRQQHRGAPCKPMMSEWLLEKPEDFEDMWLGVLCPAGKRVIVLASRVSLFSAVIILLVNKCNN